MLLVVSNEGLKALKNRPDLPLAIPIDNNGDPDLNNVFEILNRMSVCVYASKPYMWEADQEGIRRVSLYPIDKGDMFEYHLLDPDSLQRFRGSELVSSMGDERESSCGNAAVSGRG